MERRNCPVLEFFRARYTEERLRRGGAVFAKVVDVEVEVEVEGEPKLCDLELTVVVVVVVDVVVVLVPATIGAQGTWAEVLGVRVSSWSQKRASTSTVGS